MADTKVSAFPPSAGLVLTDIFPVVDDPGGTPEAQRATLSQLLTLFSSGPGSFVLKAGDTMTGALAVGNGTIVANAPVLSLSQTWNNAAVAFTGVLSNVTSTAAASGSLLFNFQKDAISVLSLRTDGVLILTGRAAFTTTSAFGHTLTSSDALNTAAPVVLNLSHTLTGGVAGVGMGVDIDQSADSTTTAGTRISRWLTTWTDATHATRTSQTSFLYFTAGVETTQLILGNNTVQLGNAGTSALPGLIFRNDVDTGFFFPSANNLGVSVGGVQVLNASSTTGIILSTSLTLPYVAKVATYTASALDYTIDCTSGTFDVDLPTAVGITGRIYVVKNSGAGVITIDPAGAELIDGAATATVVAGASATVQSTGVGYIII